MWKFVSLVASWAALVTSSAVSAQDFGYSTSSDGKKWVMDSGDGLTVTMLRSTCDIVSIKYKEQELQYKAKYTHLYSGLAGLGTVTSGIKTLDDEKKTIQITCDIKGITQYYFFRPNDNAIYMGTYHTTDLVLPELRFLARLDRSTVTSGIPEATLDDTVRAIEAKDVYAAADNTTRSKFYSGVPFIHDHIHGVRGSKAGVYFVLSEHAYEHSIGGPFYRDINNQCTTANELTFYMKSDHTRTEDYRYGFHGPYALVFTDGPAPASTSVADFTIFQNLDLKGFVREEERGSVQGTIQDPEHVLANQTVVVGFKNADAQYWTELSEGSSTFQSPLMKEGTYTVSVYKKQFVVSTATVEIAAGEAATQDVQITFSENEDALWRIGEWDGTPDGFLNADKIHVMHPSDSRMAPFVPLNFTVGMNDDAEFPLALFRGVNDPLNILFDLTEKQVAEPRVLKIGVSLAQMNGRTTVRVNDKWSGPVLATAAVKTRGITRGTTTGNYIIYEYKIPASALQVGENKVALGIASGNTDAAETFLHACVVFDALELA